MKFAHLADTHIRNLKYHKEYRVVFSQLYEKLKEEKVDYIVHCGDIAHTKTQISPEFVEMCTDFFRGLADIAPTYLILGNHDGNLKNSSRQDALTPIVDALGHPNETSLDNNFVLNVLSVFDRDNWQKPSDNEHINIALYHGSISNCKTDLNWTMDHGEDELDIFKEFDYAMLGDIHKRQSLDKHGRIRYCGSTIQQNHGETKDKGFLLWEIEDKEDFTVRHIELSNPKPFITIQLTPKGKIPKGTKIPPTARLRLVSDNNLPLDSIRKAADIAKKRFKPESVTFLNRSAGQRGSVEDITQTIFKEDLRDVAVQEELIEEYLKDYQADDIVLRRVHTLNSKFNNIIEKDEEVARNINWKLLSLEWDNLFNYGEGNKIRFDKLNGVVGILGKNFSGKSSIIDSLLFTLFNSTSKNSRKNLNIINQNKEIGTGRVEILVNGRVYSVERSSEKYVKRLKGEETLEAKTDLNFKYVNELGNTVSVNGLSRGDTDRNIRKVFGTLDDFLLTSMASQHGALSFISEGSTKRKEILAKFLDLELFEKKFRIAKEEASDLKGAIRRVEDRDFDTELQEASAVLETNEQRTQDKKRECYNLELQVAIQQGEKEAVQQKIQSIPAEIVNISEVNTELTSSMTTLAATRAENKTIEETCEGQRTLYRKIINFTETFDIDSYHAKEKEINNLTEMIDASQRNIDKVGQERDLHQRKIELLTQVPCGEEYINCKFIKDAHVSKRQLPPILEKMRKENNTFLSLRDNISAYDVTRVHEHIRQYEKVLLKRDAAANEIAQCELKIEKNNNQIIILENYIKELKNKKQTYDNNREAIENYSDLLRKENEIGDNITQLRAQIEECNEEMNSLLITHGGYVERVGNIQKQQEDLSTLREEYEAYDLLMRCMHPNGISYDVIKKRLPLINEEIAKVLANVVDFEIFFEEEGNRLNILIKHPKHDARPLEIGSGAEKSIAAMAIRLALLNVSTLPKPNLFILDEPGTSLDEENMEGFVRILDLVKSYFDTVLLISHLDSLKDSVDSQVVIEKENGFAHVDI